MDLADKIITELHKVAGYCGHCGKKTCAGKSSNSKLPNTLKTDVVLATIQSVCDNAPDGLKAAELAYLHIIRTLNDHSNVQDGKSVVPVLRDFIAAATGRTAEEVQNEFEGKAIDDRTITKRDALTQGMVVTTFKGENESWAHKKRPELWPHDIDWFGTLSKQDRPIYGIRVTD